MHRYLTPRFLASAKLCATDNEPDMVANNLEDRFSDKSVQNLTNADWPHSGIFRQRNEPAGNEGLKNGRIQMHGGDALGKHGNGRTQIP